MRCDGRDNTKKMWSFNSIVVPSKNKNKNKNPLNGYSDIEKNLFYNKSIRSNNENKNDYYDIIIYLSTIILYRTVFNYLM